MENSKRKTLTSALLAAIGFNAQAKSPEEDLWRKNHDARQRYFEKTIGPLPADIQKMLSMTGVWPGGGLYEIPAPKLGSGLAVYTTFGLTNTDMPARLRSRSSHSGASGNKDAAVTGRLEKRDPAPQRPGSAGYGYEVLVIARQGQPWALNLLQWLVNAEILRDVGLLDRVEKYNGLTIEDIDIGAPDPANVFVAKASAPLPTGTQLPSGSMDLLVATVITEEEMRWAMSHSRPELLQKLKASATGQTSVLGRSSVIR